MTCPNCNSMAFDPDINYCPDCEFGADDNDDPRINDYVADALRKIIDSEFENGRLTDAVYVRCLQFVETAHQPQETPT
jgi:hypothetical protein